MTPTPRTLALALAAVATCSLLAAAPTQAVVRADDVTAQATTTTTAGVPVRLGMVGPPAPLNGSNDLVTVETIPVGCKLSEGLDVNSAQFYHSIVCPPASAGGKVVLAVRDWNASILQTVVPAQRYEQFTLAFTKATTSNKVAPVLTAGLPADNTICGNSTVLVPVTAAAPSTYEPIFGLPVKVSASVLPAGATRPVVTFGTATTDINGRAWVSVKIPRGATVTTSNTAAGLFSPASTVAAPRLVDCGATTTVASADRWPTNGSRSATSIASINLQGYYDEAYYAMSGSVALALKYTSTTGLAKSVALGTGVLPALASPMDYLMFTNRMLPGESSSYPGIKFTWPAVVPTDVKAGTTPQVVATITGTPNGKSATATLGPLPTLQAPSVNAFATVYAPTTLGSAAGYTAGVFADGGGPGVCIPNVMFSLVVRNAAGKEFPAGSGKTDAYCTRQNVVARVTTAGTLVLKVAKGAAWPASSRDLGAVKPTAAVTVAGLGSKATWNLSARVTPNVAGTAVTFYAKNAAGVRTAIGTGTTSATGIATYTWTPTVAGVYSVTAVSAASTAANAGESALPKAITVVLPL